MRPARPPASGRTVVDLVLSRLDHAPARLGHFVPGSGQVAERFRDDQPRLVAEPLQPGVVRVELLQRADVGAEEERARVAFARVAESPDGSRRPSSRRSSGSDAHVVPPGRSPRSSPQHPARGRPDRLRARTSAPSRKTSRSPSSLRSPGTARDRWRSEIALDTLEVPDRAVVHPEPAPCRKGWQFVCCTASPPTGTFIDPSMCGRT